MVRGIVKRITKTSLMGDWSKNSKEQIARVAIQGAETLLN